MYKYLTFTDLVIISCGLNDDGTISIAYNCKAEDVEGHIETVEVIIPRLLPNSIASNTNGLSFAATLQMEILKDKDNNYFTVNL